MSNSSDFHNHSLFINKPFLYKTTIFNVFSKKLVFEQTCFWTNLFSNKLVFEQTCLRTNLFSNKLVYEQTCFWTNLFLNKLVFEQTCLQTNLFSNISSQIMITFRPINLEALNLFYFLLNLNFWIGRESNLTLTTRTLGILRYKLELEENRRDKNETMFTVWILQ